MTIARTLAEYAHDLKHDDSDDDEIAVAKARLLGSLACAFAEFGEPTVERTLDYARRTAGNDAPILGGAVSVENATLANGTLVR